MAISELLGKVQTVLGPIDPDQLGITLTHEHLLIDLGCYFELPAEASERAWVDAPVTMDRLGGLGRRLYNLDNLKLLNERTVIQEVLRFRYAGGNSLVDTTSIGIARDPLALARISRATGLNIVMGASHYIPLSYPSDMDERSEEAIADQIINDITAGVGDTGVKAGIIGEVGNLWPMTDNQRKVLRASGYAQKETGAPISIHPGIHRDSPAAILDVLIEAGAQPENIIMGHLDFFDDDGLLRDVAQSGCSMEFDLFGSEDTSLDELAGQPAYTLNDVQRMAKLELLVDEGHEARIVVAHDVCEKRQYGRFGGKSYDHILTNIVPRMRKRGFTEEQIAAILVENPKRALTFR